MALMVNNELERMWKKVVMPVFEILPHHLPGGTEEIYQKPQNTSIIS
jgi:hypothetical protein